MSVSIVAGLGNPGKAYAKTRHNIGFVVLDALASRQKLAWREEPKFEAEVARWEKSPGRTLLLVKPLTFMNDSGRALRKLADFYKLSPGDITAAYDDLNIDLGRIKVSLDGSAGGHNGVASMLEHVGNGFVRYRLGIGAKHPREMDLKDYVLGKFSSEEQPIIDQQLPAFVNGLALLIDKGPAQAMNALNRRSP